MEKLKWITFKEGNLKGISLYSTTSYINSFVLGNSDKEMVSDISRYSTKDVVIFDVGAFIGVDSMVFAKFTSEKSKIIAFEPNPSNRERLKKNLQKNPTLAKKITVSPYALSNTTDDSILMTMSKNIDSGFSSTSRITGAHSKINRKNLPDGFYELSVHTKKLDDFVKESGIAPSVVKVDIEGAEHLMLKGSVKTIKRYKPLLFIEIHSEFCAISCYQILSKLGYAVSIIHEEEDNRIMIKAEYSGFRVKAINKLERFRGNEEF